MNAISPEAKTAAKAAGLDDNQTALLAIASERSPEAQLAKVRGARDPQAQAAA
jgi:hypothetical protein